MVLQGVTDVALDISRSPIAPKPDSDSAPTRAGLRMLNQTRFLCDRRLGASNFPFPARRLGRLLHASESNVEEFLGVSPTFHA